MHVLQCPERLWGYRFCACCLWQFASSATAYTSIWGWTKDPFCRCAISGVFSNSFERLQPTLAWLNTLFKLFISTWTIWRKRERERDTRKIATKVAHDCNVGGVRMASISMLPMSKLSMPRASFSQPLPFLWLMLHANFCHCSEATKTTFQT